MATRKMKRKPRRIGKQRVLIMRPYGNEEEWTGSREQTAHKAYILQHILIPRHIARGPCSFQVTWEALSWASVHQEYLAEHQICITFTLNWLRDCLGRKLLWPLWPARIIPTDGQTTPIYPPQMEWDIDIHRHVGRQPHIRVWISAITALALEADMPTLDEQRRRALQTVPAAEIRPSYTGSALYRSRSAHPKSAISAFSASAKPRLSLASAVCSQDPTECFAHLGLKRGRVQNRILPKPLLPGQASTKAQLARRPTTHLHLQGCAITPGSYTVATTVLIVVIESLLISHNQQRPFRGITGGLMQIAQWKQSRPRPTRQCKSNTHVSLSSAGCSLQLDVGGGGGGGGGEGEGEGERENSHTNS